MDAIKNKLPLVARILLGLMFTVFGLNGFLHFIPMPPPEGAVAAFMGALAASGYMFPLIFATQLVSGLLLLSGRFVPLALVLLAPVLVHILGFHAAVAGGGFGMPIFVIALELFLAWSYRDSFKGVLDANAKPVKSDATPELRAATAR